jgi:hypothetical protein
MASIKPCLQEPINSTGTLLALMRFGKPALVTKNHSLASYVPTRLLDLANLNIKNHVVDPKKYRDILEKYNFNDSVFLSYFDSDLCNLAKILAENYQSFFSNMTNNSKGKTSPIDWEFRFFEINSRFERQGLPLLKFPSKSATFKSICLRVASIKFWRRTLRVTQARTLEAEHIILGHVSRKTKQLYVSNEAVNRFESKRIRNNDLLESLEAVNQDGYSATLLDLASVSTSNPELRRNELMTRLRGLEEYADNNKLVGEFYTLTCPSSFHRYSSKRNRSGFTQFINDKFSGASPRDSQAYLNLQWQKIRAELGRRNLPLLGMRVAEPHNDGTPHWHMLFFIKKEHRTAIRQVFRHYALEVNPDEKGAQKHRFTAIKINKKSKTGKKQSAVGYIAKYISKNLSVTNSHSKHASKSNSDLKTSSFDNDGTPFEESINRVQTWASLWGIRQFQQIGGERITIWRELRRIRKDDADSVPFDFKSIHEAADTGNYLDFLVECLKRKKIEIIRKHTLLGNSMIELIDDDGVATYHHDRDFINIFEELRPAPIIGLRTADSFIFTRQNEWQLQQRRVSALGLVSITVPAH